MENYCFQLICDWLEPGNYFATLNFLILITVPGALPQFKHASHTKKLCKVEKVSEAVERKMSIFSHNLLNAHILLNARGFSAYMWVLAKLAFVVCEKRYNSLCFSEIQFKYLLYCFQCFLCVDRSNGRNLLYFFHI